MSNITVVGHVVAVLLTLLQCGLAVVLAYRLFLLSRVNKGLDPHRRATTVNFLKVHRVCIFIMTTLQCVRCIDPFCTSGIWTYAFLRFLQLAVTITIYFQYSATTYVVMDTLYACALKRTPGWLAVVVSILPVSQFAVGFGMLACEYLVAQQWVSAVISFYVVLVLSVNLTTYNVSGFWLIRILRKHQLTGVSTSGEDITGSKSASPFDVVIRKTMRSMTMLTLPSLAALLMFLILGIGSVNTRPLIPYNPNAPNWTAMATLSIQLILGLLFTRVAWISKTALDAEIMIRTISTPSKDSALSSEGSPEQKRSGRAASRASLKERAARMSQSPKPRYSEQRSRTEPEPVMEPVVAVTVDDARPEGTLVPASADIV